MTATPGGYEDVANTGAGYSYIPPPTVDPSKLTTDAVNAATDQWRRDLQAEAHTIGVRLHAMDQATTLRLKDLDNLPIDTARQISNLERLHNEKFASIALQFKERDIRTEQAAIAQKQALDAALLAAKELVGQQNTANVEAAAKSEASFTKQNDQTTVLIATLEKALTDRILELKERIDRGEGSSQGANESHTETRLNVNLVLGGISVFLVLVSVALAVFLAVRG